MARRAYVAISSTGPLPIDPADVVPDEGAHARLAVSEHFAGACRGADQGTAGMLPTRHPRRPPARRGHPGLAVTDALTVLAASMASRFGNTEPR
jgi:hypothetical protein